MFWSKKVPEEVKPENLEIDVLYKDGVAYINAVDVAHFMSVSEDAELIASTGGYRRWDTQQRDAIATVVGKIRSKILAKAAGHE